MQTITINVGDDQAITVEVEENGQAGEPYECDSVEEALQFVGAALGEESQEPAAEQASEPGEDYAAAWDEEAGKRQPAAFER